MIVSIIVHAAVNGNGGSMLLTSNLSIAYGSYDHLEYAGIWIIALVMTFWGMTAALIASVIAALSTYAVQVSIECDVQGWRKQRITST
jgi:hypothetical protein